MFLTYTFLIMNARDKQDEITRSQNLLERARSSAHHTLTIQGGVTSIRKGKRNVVVMRHADGSLYRMRRGVGEAIDARHAACLLDL